MIQLLFLFLFPFTLVAQQNLHIKLTFGDYTNDHSAYKFYAQERIWELNGHLLTYQIDAHDTRYSDSLQLTKVEVDSVIQFVNENKLCQDFHKELESTISSIAEHSEEIRGSMEMNGKTFEIDLRAKGYGMLDKDPDGKKFDELEQIFYLYVERER